MRELTSPVRIAIAVGDGIARAPVQADRDPRGTMAALDRLGAGVRIEPMASLAACASAAREVDLVVLDGIPPEGAGEVLAAARAGGAPVLAVVAPGDDDAVIEWFRRGAADCVEGGPDGQRVVAGAALELVRRTRDLRERRSVERRLAWLEHLSTTIVKEIPAALAVVDAERRLVMTNPAFRRAWGRAGERLRGRPLEQVLPADLMESGGIRSMLDRVAASQAAPPSVARGSDPAGTPVAFDVRAERLDEQGRLLVVLADVTERELLARRIADLKRYNENIIQNLNSALLVTDNDGTITFANGMATQILGEPEGTLQGRSVWEWFPAAGGKGALLARCLAHGERSRGAETLLTRSEGTVVPVGISCAPLLDADGTRLGAVAVFQDLTEITMLQRQVLQTEKMASIGQLAAGVAHEINNPMGFIHANLAQMAEYLSDLRQIWNEVAALRKAAASGDAGDVRRTAEDLERVVRELDAEYVLSDFVKAIRESQEGSERIRHIVRDLRDFSRRDSEERVEADLNQCLDSTANIVWSMMKHSVVLKKRYADLPRVRCWPMQLQQVFMNLLVNAYQAIEERVGQSGEQGEIELITERRDRRVVVTVADTGVGIPADQIDRIFDPFFTTKEVGAGTGLGLSTSYNIVRKHGGTIRAANRAGAGATFEVILPLAPEPDAGGPA